MQVLLPLAAEQKTESSLRQRMIEMSYQALVLRQTKVMDWMARPMPKNTELGLRLSHVRFGSLLLLKIKLA